MDIFSSVIRCLKHCSEQARVLSFNVANVHTPGFKARKVREFAIPDLLSLNLTSPLHSDSSVSFKLELMQGQEKPNGNNVNILQQTSLAASNQTSYDVGLTLLRSLFELANLAQGTK